MGDPASVRYGLTESCGSFGTRSHTSPSRSYSDLADTVLTADLAALFLLIRGSCLFDRSTVFSYVISQYSFFEET